MTRDSGRSTLSGILFESASATQDGSGKDGLRCRATGAEKQWNGPARQRRDPKMHVQAGGYGLLLNLAARSRLSREGTGKHQANES